MSRIGPVVYQTTRQVPRTGQPIHASKLPKSKKIAKRRAKSKSHLELQGALCTNDRIAPDLHIGNTRLGTLHWDVRAIRAHHRRHGSNEATKPCQAGCLQPRPNHDLLIPWSIGWFRRNAIGAHDPDDGKCSGSVSGRSRIAAAIRWT